MVSDFADVQQAVLVRQNLHERAEFLDADDLALIDPADLDFRRDGLDLLDGALCGFAIRREMWIVPSSSMSIWQPVASTIPLMTLPCGPMTAPIFSGLIWIAVMRGAYFESSARGDLMASAILPRMNSRASRA